MKIENYKKYIPVIIVGTILVLINLFAVIWYFLPAGPDQWKDDIVPGKVVSIDESNLITTDPRGNTKTFLITPQTKFYAGKTVLTETSLATNNFVLVQLDLSTSTPFVAKEVRIVTDKRKEKKKQ